MITETRGQIARCNIWIIAIDTNNNNNKSIVRKERQKLVAMNSIVQCTAR